MDRLREIHVRILAVIALAAPALAISACKLSQPESELKAGDLSPFVLAGGRVEGRFRSSSGHELTAAVAKGQPNALSLSLRFGGRSFDVRVDRKTRRVSSQGGPWKLRPYERALLREFAHKAWSGARTAGAETRGAIVRAAGMASFLADAPPELKTFAFTLRPPGEVERACCPCDPEDPAPPQCTDCPRQCQCYPNGCGPACVPDQSGQIGIRELPNTCCTAAPPGADAQFQHDACGHTLITMPGKCGWTDDASSGRGIWCQGRCGQGCTAADIYTQDCLDHDLCEGHDDPARDCTDEWWEAADDFAYIYLLLPDPINWCGRCPSQPCFQN